MVGKSVVLIFESKKGNGFIREWGGCVGLRERIFDSEIVVVFEYFCRDLLVFLDFDRV